jgi:histidyl-tRNA synthetase
VPFPSIEQTQHRNELVASLRNHMSLYGYQSVELPFIEEADLFLTRAGDQIINQLFTFERFGKQLSLRPEFTASAVYRYGHLEGHPVVRWQFDGPVFIDSEEYAVNHYQSYSIGAELIGLGGPLPDAEMILMAAGGLEAQGITDFTLIMGHIGLMRHLLGYFSLDKRTERFLLHQLPAFSNPEQGKAHILQKVEQALLGKYHATLSQNEGNTAVMEDTHRAEDDTARILDSLLASDNRGTTMGGRTRQDIARRLVQKQKRANEYPQIIDALDFLEQWSLVHSAPEKAFTTIAQFINSGDTIGHDLLAEWKTIVQVLEQQGLNTIKISPALSRDWDYYTGNVFEIQATNGQSLAGGGRYDELVSLISGKDAPAVGFAYDVDTILQTVASTFQGQKRLSLGYADESSLQALEWAMLIRQHGVIVTLLSADSSSINAQITLNGQLVFNNMSYSPDELDAFISEFQGSPA